jgi:NAD(P)-dependent dehydrogenase (short-subunit alcohol dehydrogenase family)
MLQDWPAEKRESLYGQTNVGRVGMRESAEGVPNGERGGADKLSVLMISAAEEIGRTILFLASEAGGYCSGSTLKVDGGWSKWC